MTDLRSACIEKMADAWARLEEGEDYEMSGVAWANLRAVAAVQLDALLGVLEDHADEWGAISATTVMPNWRSEDWAGYGRGHVERIAQRLLAVLREDT